MPSKKQNDDDYTGYNDHMSNRGEAVMRRRRYYPTRHGGFCVNALTGSRYPYIQGSFESLRLYQVVDSSGLCDSRGYVRTNKDPSNQTPNFLFYDSPEQYSRHQKVDVDPKSAYQWHADIKSMFPDDQFDKAAYLEIRKRKHGIGEVPVSKSSASEEAVAVNDDDEWN